jgi:hypothetical protein
MAVFQFNKRRTQMKNFLLITFITLNLSIFGQTKIIALKSHSGDSEFLNNETDGNFGISPVRLDSVVKIGPKCIVEIDNFGGRDTIFEHPAFLNPNITLEELKKQYPRIKFVGFEKDWKESNGLKTKPRKGSLYLFGILMVGIMISQWRKKILLKY